MIDEATPALGRAEAPQEEARVHDRMRSIWLDAYIFLVFATCTEFLKVWYLLRYMISVLHDVFIGIFSCSLLRISDDMIKRFGWLVTVADTRCQGFAHELGMTAGWILFWDNGDSVVWA